MTKLFGFSIDDSDKKPDSVVAPVPQNNEDGLTIIYNPVFTVSMLI